MERKWRLDGWYLDLLREIQRHTRPGVYIEIGVWEGDSLRCVQPGTRVLAVDPKPRLDPELVASLSAEVFAERSDDFFERDVPTFDLAFVDGSHVFEDALRDLRNLEAIARPDSVVMLHDVWPPAPEWATREWQDAPGWTGDVWKLLPALAEFRPDLTLTIAAAKPSGIGIITGLDPSNRVLHDDYDRIVAEYVDRPYVDYRTSVGIPPVAGDWGGVGKLFARTWSDRAGVTSAALTRNAARVRRRVERTLRGAH